MAAAAAALLTALAAAGCAASEGGSGDSRQAEEWAEPAWFAQQAREGEEAQAALQACMDGRGWSVPITKRGGSPTGFTDEDEAAAFMADSTTCLADLGMDLPTVGDAEAREFYGYQLDTLACLRHQGVDMPDAPSQDVYVETTVRFFAGDESADYWEPYDDLWSLAEHGEIDADAVTAAEAACPQYWIH
ncbi:hypothetical protein QUV83_00785 [Cellulomonas cellasea]|uniref:hypothetical protein n=1 Tax=Cellulomonas cellasea TaxID=43670 RepID=UPI0025A3C331|nr:hypothetical protein [Cellulomonas cellasea]MDM8083301.1 hypothetical protein [Cellulomonas cellasea]